MTEHYYVVEDGLIPGADRWRIVPYSAVQRRKEQNCSAEPMYIATVYGAEHARQIASLLNVSALDAEAIRADERERCARALAEYAARYDVGSDADEYPHLALAYREWITAVEFVRGLK